MQYIDLLIQIPLVGIFVFFVLKMTKETTSFLDRRDEQWQMFLDKLSCQHDESLRGIRASVDDLARQVGRNTAVLLLVYRKEGDKEGQRLIEELVDEYRRG